MPYIIFEAETSIARQRLIEILESSTTKLNWFGRPKSSAPFIGKVSNGSFRIMRVLVHHRDSFNPVLYGKFLSSSSGSRIRVVMTYHPVIWLIMLAWTAYFGYGLVGSLLSYGYTEVIPFVLLFFIFPWAIGIPFFFIEASESKVQFLNILRSADTKNGT